MEDAFRLACGDIGMAPSEFWRLTYVELRLVLEGCAERRQREIKIQRNLDAWTTAYLLAPHYKEPITPAMLLGKKEKQPRKTKEQEIDEALTVAFKHYRRGKDVQ